MPALMERTHRLRRRLLRPGRDTWILFAIVIFIGVSFWELSIVESQNSLMGSLNDDIFELNINANDKLDPIATYAREMNLSRVPPRGSPPNLPSERIDSSSNGKGGLSGEVSKIREKNGYGGTGDKAHLGGFTSLDLSGVSPFVWKYMMEYFGVKKLLDVGCGRGISTSWFYMQGVQVQCVEGSRDAIQRNVLPALVDVTFEKDNHKKNSLNITSSQEIHKNIIVEHDFTLGPWWPEDTVDAVWCVELLEHVSRNFAPNYLAAMKKSALVFATHSVWGGWHHTEVHDDTWWINKFQMYGFVYSSELTTKVRKIAEAEKDAKIPAPKDGENQFYRASHIMQSMMVFINPNVASRAEHSHLLSEPGCYDDRSTHHKVPCGEEKNRNTRIVNSVLPDSFKPIPYKKDRHQQWEEFLKMNVEQDKAQTKTGVAE